ncbi:MAG: GNAT family N-acetyltransferase [Pseudomonadales bacterium]|nr:GNAT family N-acetyltransferase [Pseudomonadales bacterium]
MQISTEIPGFSIRAARPDDCALILGFIQELADYEKLSHEVLATPDILRETLFGERRYAEVLIGEYEGRAVAYALFFHNFSTFTGRPGIYLEDIYVQPAMRGKGFGKTLMTVMAKLAVDRKCTRLEWSVLDWNEPSIRFYRSIGAIPMDGWTVQRMTGDALTALAGQFRGTQQ